MFVGHGLVAFALVAWLAARAGWADERALALGVLAGAFGLAPDVDILYAPVGVVGASGLLDAGAAFWAAGNVVHRTVTHSLLVGAVAALAAACWSRGDRRSRAAALALSGVVVAVAAREGALQAAIALAFVVAVLALARWGRVQGFAPRYVGGVALVGLLSHPFGDLFTGEPPAFLYPLDVTLVAHRVVLAPDPTLHLLAAFAVELATAWLAALVYLRLHDYRLLEYVNPRATLAVGYAAAALLLPPPTLAVSYHFVFSVLGVGVALALGVRPETWRRLLGRPWLGDRHPYLAAAVTGLSAVTVALAAYAAAYVAL